MTRDDFRNLVREKILILDGATGTELSKRGMPCGVSPEKYVSEHPETIVAVQDSYRASGSDIVYAPTFGGNRLKLAEFGLENEVFELNRSLASVAVAAAGEKLVFGDMAPTGQFIAPCGELDFEAAVSVYGEQAGALIAGGVAGFAVETMMDLQEARAALLGIRSVAPDMPVIVTLTFEKNGRTLTGNDPVAALVALQSLGADAFGCNCSTGPDDMAKIIAMLKPYAAIPLVAKPNAGLPQLRDGKTVFSMDPEEFASHAPELIASGAGIVGGCCGTTPEHIAALAAAVKHLPPPEIRPRHCGVVSSARAFRVLSPDSPFAVIGERINPTGKKALQEALRGGDVSVVMDFASEQEEGGASLLDVNVGLSGIDEKAVMCECLDRIALASSLPVCVDSTRPDVVEAALRRYPGRALLNSISAEKNRLEHLLPVAAKYGAMLILLPLTDEGIPSDGPGRIKVVEQLLEAAGRYGYAPCDVAVDALVMTVSTGADAPRAALEVVDFCRANGLNSVCGLSNVSYGLPGRAVANLAFLGMALGRGLNMAIANPGSRELMDMVAASDVLSGRDRKMANYLARFGNAAPAAAAAKAARNSSEQVQDCVMRGDDEGIIAVIDKALSDGETPEGLLKERLIPAINEVGARFERKEYFLPQLIMSADAMRRGTEYLQSKLSGDGMGAKAGKIILATVKGDIHDIGKNIVGVMLRNYGFEVIDLGKDVAAETILDAAQRENVKIIGLSALMTGTMPEMKTVTELAKARGMTDLTFIVGGAVLDAVFAGSIGAHYAPDAMAAVRLAGGKA